jgi:hypothetical protein
MNREEELVETKREPMNFLSVLLIYKDPKMIKI